MSKLSRTKGHSFEREIAAELREFFPEARRHLEYHSRDANGVDVSHTGEFKIQCKRGRKWHSISAIEEIQCDQVLGDVPVLVTKGDNKPIMAVLHWDDFKRLLRAYLQK